MPLDPEEVVRNIQRNYDGIPRGAAVAKLREAMEYGDPGTEELDPVATEKFLAAEAGRGAGASFYGRAARALGAPAGALVRGAAALGDPFAQAIGPEGLEEIGGEVLGAFSPYLAWASNVNVGGGAPGTTTPADVEAAAGYGEPGFEPAPWAGFAGDVMGSLPAGVGIQNAVRPVARAVATRLAPGVPEFMRRAAGGMGAAPIAGEAFEAAAPALSRVARNANVLENVGAGVATTAAFGETDPTMLGVGGAVGGAVGIAGNMFTRLMLRPLTEALEKSPPLAEAARWLAQQRARARHMSVDEAMQGITRELTTVGEFQAAYNLAQPSGLAPKLQLTDLLTAEDVAAMDKTLATPWPGFSAASAQGKLALGETPLTRTGETPKLAPDSFWEPGTPTTGTQGALDFSPPPTVPEGPSATLAAAQRSQLRKTGWWDPAPEPVERLRDAQRDSGVLFVNPAVVANADDADKLWFAATRQKAKVDSGALDFVELTDEGDAVRFDLTDRTMYVPKGVLASSTPEQLDTAFKTALSNVEESANVVTQSTDNELTAFAKDPLGTLFEPTVRVTNASGESAASLEAQSRLASETSAGIRRYVFDTRSNKARPLIGADAVDVQPGTGEVVVRVGPAGEVLDFTQGKGVTSAGLVRMEQQMPRVVTPPSLAEFGANDVYATLGVDVPEARALGLVYEAADGSLNLTPQGQQALLTKPASQVLAEARAALRERQARIARFMRPGQRGAVRYDPRRKSFFKEGQKARVFGKTPMQDTSTEFISSPAAALNDPDIVEGLRQTGRKPWVTDFWLPHRLFASYQATSDMFIATNEAKRKFNEVMRDKLLLKLSSPRTGIASRIPKGKENEVGRLVANLVRNEDNSFTQTLPNYDEKLNELAIETHRLIDEAREVHGVKPQAIAILRAQVPEWEQLTPDQRVKLLQEVRQAQEGTLQGLLPGSPMEKLARDTQGMLTWDETSDLYKAIDDRAFSILPDESEAAAIEEEIRLQMAQGTQSPGIMAALREKQEALEKVRADIESRATRPFPRQGVIPRRQMYGPLETAGLPSAQLFGWSKNFESNVRRVIDRSMASRMIDVALHGARKALPEIQHDQQMVHALEKYLYALRGARGYVEDRSIAEAVNAISRGLGGAGKVVPDQVRGAAEKGFKLLYFTRLVANPAYYTANSLQPFMTLMPFVKKSNYVKAELASLDPKWWARAREAGVVKDVDAYLAELGRDAGRFLSTVGAPARFVENRNRVVAFAAGVMEAKTKGWKPPRYLRLYNRKVSAANGATQREIEDEAGRALSDYTNYMQGDLDQPIFYAGGSLRRATGLWRRFGLNYAGQWRDAYTEAKSGNVEPLLFMTAALMGVGGVAFPGYEFANDQLLRKTGYSIPRVSGLSMLADLLMGTGQANIDVTRSLNPLPGLAPRSLSEEDLFNYFAGPALGTPINLANRALRHGQPLEAAASFVSPSLERGIRAGKEWYEPPTTPSGEAITEGRTGAQIAATGLGLLPSVRSARAQALREATAAFVGGYPEKAEEILRTAEKRYGLWFGPKTRAKIQRDVKREVEYGERGPFE